MITRGADNTRREYCRNKMLMLWSKTERNINQNHRSISGVCEGGTTTRLTWWLTETAPGLVSHQRQPIAAVSPATATLNLEKVSWSQSKLREKGWKREKMNRNGWWPSENMNGEADSFVGSQESRTSQILEFF